MGGGGVVKCTYTRPLTQRSHVKIPFLKPKINFLSIVDDILKLS